MTLVDFMEENIYKDAGCIEYIGVDGMELNEDEENLLDCDVIQYHKCSGGCLEITLNIL